ncbi:hypothetical protein N802_08710 [Knoellia sinensis KCTC 19936]|uniref:AB hydrolase-1 domain-containing protein n=1 Tax=Knoellia sinensis KCTC 19936 TaxID=1385520 RepID=A0A0A0JA30_9MICO|nr:alpha/beta hydrolase [Knoellia sinensis]KGN33978.1 hypothetical protein N802_08710 [Knoellia sinensis KCTC 19936]
MTDLVTPAPRSPEKAPAYYPAPVRVVFGIAERWAPAVGARLAHSVAGNPPRPPERVRARRPEGFTPGRAVSVSVEGGRVAAWEWGAGDRTVYLTHGALGWGHQFAWFVGPLAERGFRVVTFDWLGHGESARVPRRMGGFEAATKWTQLLDALGPAYAVVAHSVGALPTYHALGHGLSVDKCVLLAPRATINTAVEGMTRQIGAGPKVLARLLSAIGKERNVSLGDFDGPAQAHEWIDIDALIVHGRHDAEVPVHEGVAVAHAWHGSHLSIIERELGHRSILRDPEVIASVVEFLEDD